MTQNNHEYKWNEIKIIHKETGYFKRSFAEMVFIKNQSDYSQKQNYWLRTTSTILRPTLRKKINWFN